MATKATNKFKDFNSEAQKRYELQAKKETMAEMKRLNDNVRKAMDEASSYRKKQGLGTLKQIKQDLSKKRKK